MYIIYIDASPGSFLGEGVRKEMYHFHKMYDFDYVHAMTLSQRLNSENV